LDAARLGGLRERGAQRRERGFGIARQQARKQCLVSKGALRQLRAERLRAEGITDEQLAQYITKLESDIGTSVNQAAFAQVTGANN